MLTHVNILVWWLTFLKQCELLPLDWNYKQMKNSYMFFFQRRKKIQTFHMDHKTKKNAGFKKSLRNA